MLYFVGLGLGDAQDITVKGLEVVRRCNQVYLEAYTSILTVGQEQLEKFYGRPVVLADRDFVEQGCDEMLEKAVSEEIAFLVVGDPFGATTHSDLVLRAKEKGVQTRVIHNASIMNAIGCVGLQLYNYGETVSIPFWSSGWEPESFFDKIESNLARGMHTLCLLDIKVKEQSVENLMKGNKIYEPPRFMSVSQAVQQILAVIERRSSNGQNEESPAKAQLTSESMAVGVARVGAKDQLLVASTLQKLADSDLGKPLHSLVIPGKMHPLEEEALAMWTSKL